VRGLRLPAAGGGDRRSADRLQVPVVRAVLAGGPWLGAPGRPRLPHEAAHG